MRIVAPDQSDLYRAYRAEIEGERLIRSTRTAALIVILLSSAFIALDALAFPADFSEYLIVRLTLNAILGVIYIWTARRYPVPSAMIGCLAIGYGLIAVIQLAGGLLGEYYPGLVLLFVGMPVFMPYSVRQSSLLVIVLLGTLAGLPLLDGPIDWRTYTLHLFFPAAAAVECVVSCAVLDGFRFRDFLRRREIEAARDQLEALDREKSRFTANVHHELRTPLTLMLAPIEAMLGGEFGSLSDLQLRYVKTMHANGVRLLKLINNLLDLAKIEGDQLEITRRPIRVGQLVESLVASARPLAERKQVALTSHGLDSLSEINVDADAVEKIVVNLVGNALKFSDRGGSIIVRGSNDPAGGIVLTVEDDGVGLPEEQLERIFDRFAQVDSSCTRKHEGTGIGLALVKELVALHEGQIWATSDGVGQGTQMHIVLPRGEPDVERPEEIIQTSDGSSQALASSIAAMEAEIEFENREEIRLTEMKRNVERADTELLGNASGDCPLKVQAGASEVLICEDNADMRRLLSFLVGQEFNVRVARNGREGLALLRERHPDLVLTDVMMPEMSGTELCEAIKSDRKTQGIPVVLVTSKAEREMKIAGLEQGADDYVTKPFHPRELLARIRSLVKLRKLQEEISVRNALLASANEELSTALRELHDAGVQLAQAERLAAVGEIAAGVAHEVNNPVNYAVNALKTLRGYIGDVCSVVGRIGLIDLSDGARLEAELCGLEKLKEGVGFDSLVDSIGELVQIAEEGLDRTQRLVAELCEFASPGDGHRVNVDLERGLRTTIQLISHEAKTAGVEIRVEIPEGLPLIEGDPKALNQVFLNLIKNAAEALEGQGGTITVEAQTKDGLVLVTVSDDGPGVAPELLTRIFEPFFSTKEAGRGSGLGLSISRRIVSEHGGAVDVKSRIGAGTTFTVSLPVQSGNRAA